MATAYTIRYGRPNAGGGPAGGAGVEGFCSVSWRCRGEAIAAALEEGEGALVRGGGSIVEFEMGCGLEGIAGSGKGGMSSSVRVSIVISFVSALAARM